MFSPLPNLTSTASFKCLTFWVDVFLDSLDVICHHRLSARMQVSFHYCHPFVLTRTTRACWRWHEPYQQRHDGSWEKFKRCRQMLWTCMSLRQVGTGEASKALTCLLLSDCLLSLWMFKPLSFFLSLFSSLPSLSLSLFVPFPHSLFLLGA